MPVIESTPEEKRIGLELFFTTTKGIKGRLKKTPEDFIVNENSIQITPVSDEQLKSRDPTLPVFAYARVIARNWEMNRLIQEFSYQLGVPSDKIFFAGTKDKRAITSQLMAFNTSPEQLKSISISDVEISDIYQSFRVFKIGDLIGNEFEITIKELELPEHELNENVAETANQLEKINGFPNFFGVQRFGVIRPITHEIGKLVLQGKFEEAVFLYIGHPMKGEPQTDFDVRSEFDRTLDFGWALENYPRHLNFERILIKYLDKHPEGHTSAFEQFPKNLVMMFIHAYQSLLFNRILCARISEGLPLNEPIIGDIILPVDIYKRPVHKTWIPVNEQNYEKIKKQCRKGKAFVSGVLFGNQTSFADGEFGELERKIIEKEGIGPDDFVIPELPVMSSKGNRRELLAPIDKFSYEITSDTVIMKFGLIKGSYATTLLREFMKTNIKNY
jgi:tRNA pseudouridine13 synthase